jgi:hypothetical protein
MTAADPEAAEPDAAELSPAVALRRRRWRSQLLADDARLDDPAEVVRWMGAVQAQDHGQSLWAVASRLRAPSLAAVEAAATAGTILRTWPMRGTLHWVAAEDAHWMVGLSADRMATTAATRRRQLGISDATLERAADVLTAALCSGGEWTRPAVMALWTDAAIPVDGQRGYHLLWNLALRRLIAIGPLSGRQQTVVLLDDHVPATRRIMPDDPGAELARRYLQSHGPCTDRDFAWWCGSTLTEARRRIAAARELDGTLGERAPEPALAGAAPQQATGVALLAGFDEYLLGYQDRSDVLPAAFADRVVPGNNGVFLPCVVADGSIVGTWKRVIGRNRVDITVTPFTAAGPSVAELTAAARGYAAAANRSEVAVSVTG